MYLTRLLDIIYLFDQARLRKNEKEKNSYRLLYYAYAYEQVVRLGGILYNIGHIKSQQGKHEELSFIKIAT